MNDVDKVKNKIDIVEYIRQFVELHRAGQNFKGLCPFHSEKSPSFMVSPERQIWHCFGCQKGGDVFTFFMEYEKADFSESLKELAHQAGVQLTQPVFRTQIEQKKRHAIHHQLSRCTVLSLFTHPTHGREKST